MKVLFQGRPDAFDAWGGDTTQMVETKEALSRLGVDVDIACELEPDLHGYDIVHIFNIQRADYGITQLLNAKRRGVPVVLSTVYWDLRHILKSDEYCCNIPHPVFQFLARVHKSLPCIALSLSPSRARKRIAEFATHMLEDADLLLPNSYAELEIIALLFKMPSVRAKALVVPNAIRADFADSEASEDEALRDLPSEYVLEVAAINPVKGQAALIQAMMDNPEIPLVFAGDCLDSPYGRKCLALGKARGNTFFVGHVPHGKLAGYYRRARVHALPSLRESPGLSTLEAAVCGANCVVSFHGPIAEYFGDDVRVCDPEDASSIRKAILDAWAAPRSTDLKERILKCFTWEEAARITLLGYQRVLQP